VREEQRRAGVGNRLLAAAENEMRRRGCGQVAVSTHSFQAPGFYARFGYRECGRTPDYPRGHDQIHLVKRFRWPCGLPSRGDRPVGPAQGRTDKPKTAQGKARPGFVLIPANRTRGDPATLGGQARVTRRMLASGWVGS
jgi:hypothetical protein